MISKEETSKKKLLYTYYLLEIIISRLSSILYDTNFQYNRCSYSLFGYFLLFPFFINYTIIFRKEAWKIQEGLKRNTIILLSKYSWTTQELGRGANTHCNKQSAYNLWLNKNLTTDSLLLTRRSLTSKIKSTNTFLCDM